MNRRSFIAALAGAGAALAADARFVETRRLEVTHHRVGPEPRAGAVSFRLAQISDLHLRSLGPLHHHLAAEIARARPDLLVFTGDAIDRAGNLALFDRFLSLLHPRTPKLAILGNWEHWGGVDLDGLARVYARHGGELLVNRTAVHVHAGRRIAFTGLDDLTGGRPDLVRAVADAEPADARILLAHSPVYRDRLRMDSLSRQIGETVLHRGVDLDALAFRMMLSGHTHGGQVAFFGYAPVLPEGSGRYVRGWFHDPGQVPLYVSRGIGTSALPVRFGSVPELAVFTLAV